MDGSGVGDVGAVLKDMLALWKSRGSRTNAEAVGAVSIIQS